MILTMKATKPVILTECYFFKQILKKTINIFEFGQLKLNK